MPKAECYYEILGIPETATTEEVKQAYKKLALVWHPDKNQNNQEEAHAKFQVILKAYETLGDSKEREWYDRHKDLILSDDQEETSCLNLFQYFSSACYANFDDSEDGFYTVYRNVFNKIVEEEKKAFQLATKYSKNKNKSAKLLTEDEYPSFGDSKSTYEEIVRPFYAFWSGFCTRLTFDNLDKWNTTEAENRRILRAMDKENKKVKDAAKKERNINVRNLVEFVKRRDRRLKAHKLLVEQQNEMNRQKTAEKQRQQREKVHSSKVDFKPASYLDMGDVEEQLKVLESEYLDYKKSKRGRRRQHFKEDSSEDSDAQEEVNFTSGDNNGCDTTGLSLDQQGQSERKELNAQNEFVDDDIVENFFCPACTKDFRSVNAYENHEASKKHKQNVQKLTKLLRADESKLIK